MSDNLLLSVIIPVYNGQIYLAECLDSIIESRIKENSYEILVINDGSTDNTQNIIDSYCKKYANVKSVSIDNSGVSIARNTGIGMASGKYAIFLDSDDKWISNDASEALSKITAIDEEVVSFGYYFGDVNCRPIKEQRINHGKKVVSVDFGKYSQHICSFAFNVDFLRAYGIQFKERCRANEDKVFVDMALYCANSVLFIDCPFYIYRHNMKSVTHAVNRDSYKVLLEVYYTRIWESEEILKMRSYGKSSNEKTVNFLQTLAEGTLLEMLKCYFRYSINVKAIMTELKSEGVYENILHYNSYDLNNVVKNEFRSFLQHPKRFAIKCRVNWIFRSILVVMLPNFIISIIEQKLARS